MTTFIKAKLKKTDEQMNIDKYKIYCIKLYQKKKIFIKKNI